MPLSKQAQVEGKCGCRITGVTLNKPVANATLDIAPEFCPLHKAAPQMVEALRLNLEHTDESGRPFYCLCPRYDTLKYDSRRDHDDDHATGCHDARAALRAAGVKP